MDKWGTRAGEEEDGQKKPSLCGRRDVSVVGRILSVITFSPVTSLRAAKSRLVAPDKALTCKV